MRQFHIFEHASPASGYAQHVAVKDGWCWPAFSATWGWAFAVRLHGVAAKILIGWIGTVVLFYFILTRIAPETAVSLWLLLLTFMIGNICVRLICGAYGNQWRRTYLTQRGYWLARTVSASTRTSALAEAQQS